MSLSFAEYRRLGTSDLRVSPICLGTMTFGQQNSEAEGHAQLDRALAAGINFIDTAEMYPVPARAETSGATETIVGNWLKGQARDKIVLATKAAGPGRKLDWIRGGPLGFGAADLNAAVDASLQRLRTDYIDLYQLYWPARHQPMFGGWQYTPAGEGDGIITPIAETLEALAGLVQAGKIRHVGVSNEHPWGVMEFARLAREAGLPRIVSIQNAYSLVNRTYDLTLAEVCHRENVGLLAYSPLAFGHLSGKYLVDPRAEGRVNHFAGFAQRYAKPGLAPAVTEYVDLAREVGISPSQLALAWCYRRWSVVSTIIGATSLAQLDENLSAWDITLSPEVLERIDAIHLRHPNPTP